MHDLWARSQGAIIDDHMSNKLVVTESTAVEGHVYVSGNGKLVIDRCRDDHDHLTSRQTRHVQPLYDCRVYLEDLILEGWVGKHGEIVVDRTVVDGVVVSVKLSFAELPVAPRAPTGEPGDRPAAPSR